MKVLFLGVLTTVFFTVSCKLFQNEKEFKPQEEVSNLFDGMLVEANYDQEILRIKLKNHCENNVVWRVTDCVSNENNQSEECKLILFELPDSITDVGETNQEEAASSEEEESAEIACTEDQTMFLVNIKQTIKTVVTEQGETEVSLEKDTITHPTVDSDALVGTTEEIDPHVCKVGQYYSLEANLSKAKGVLNAFAEALTPADDSLRSIDCYKVPAGSRTRSGINNSKNLPTQTPVVKNCDDPKKTGLCRARFPRFYYKPEINSCEQFIYGGCGANGNNFETEQACQEMCVKEESSQ